MRKRIVAGALVGLLALPAGAQFGIPGPGGIPVIDNSVLLESIQITINAVKTVREIQRQYSLWEYETRRLGNMGRFRSPRSVWNRIGSYADSRGQIPPRVRDWLDAANTARRTVDVWRDSAYKWPFPFRMAAIDKLPQDAQDRIQQDADHVDLIDNTAVAALEAVGQARYYGQIHDQQLGELIYDETHDDPGVHTATKLAQRSNLYAGMQSKQLGDLQRMVAAQTELAILQAKRERDAEVLALRTANALRQAEMQLLEQADSGGLLRGMMARRQQQ